MNSGHMSVELTAADKSMATFNKFDFEKKYSGRLHTMKLHALFSTALCSFNWFLGVCALTWASAVILGGVLTELSAKDYYSVSALLLLEALRLAAATFFANVVTRKLIHRSTHPNHITYEDKKRDVILSGARILDQTCQLMVLAVSIFLPLKRLPALHPQDRSSDFDSLSHSLRIFYILVLLNAAIAVVGVLHSKSVVPLFATTFSLRRYYDHVFWRGMEKGLLYATNFDFFEFSFKTLADEYRRNLRASVVYALYHDLIDYIYSHNRGFDATRIAMDSSDDCEQKAAANIVGLWMSQIKGIGSSLLLQSRLLTKLADALDHQETGRAATCSFESLAKSDAEGVLDVKNERGERLMLILMNCIGTAVKAKKADKALVFIKVLIQLLMTEAGRKEAEATDKRRRQEAAAVVEDLGRQNEAAEIKGKLAEDLWSVFRGEGCKKRTVGVAGKALMLVMREEMSAAEVDKWLRAPVPSGKEHVLEDEKGYLLELLGNIEIEEVAGGGERFKMWEKRVSIRPDTSPHRIPSSTNMGSSLIGLLFFWLIVIAVILCLYKANI